MNRSKRLAHLHDTQARQAEWTKYPHFLIADPGKEATAEYSQFLKDHLLRINTLVNTHGASLIILFIPDYAQLFHPEFKHINRIIRALSNELGISFLDMTPIYEATEQFRPNYFWPLDGHTNEVGHQAITDALLPVVGENLNKRHIPCRLTPAATRDLLATLLAPPSDFSELSLQLTVSTCHGKLRELFR